MLNWVSKIKKGLQNGWGCKGPLELICSNTLFKKGHLEPVAHNHVRVTFVCLQEWGPYHLPGQPMTVLGYPHRKKMFPDVTREPPVFQSVLMPLSLYLSSLHPSFRYFYTLMGFHLSLVFSTLNNLGCLMWNTPVPSIFMAPCWISCSSSVSLVVESPGLDAVLQVWLTDAEQRSLDGSTPPNARQHGIGPLGCKGMPLACVQLGVQKDITSFSESCLPAAWPLARTDCCMG